MQEPVLFNKDIKTNILFGKLDATDEEVYLAAQKANALQFIESGEDDLTLDQKQEKLEKDFKELFADMTTNNLHALAGLYDQFSGKSEFFKKLMIELYENASREFLQQANENDRVFVDAVEKVSKKYGASWADIVIHFEWRDELELIYNKFTDTTHQKMVSQVLEKYPELHCCFNAETLLAALKVEDISDVEAFALFIRED